VFKRVLVLLVLGIIFMSSQVLASVDLDFDNDDFTQLFSAVRYDGNSPDFIYNTRTKPENEMPTYDKYFCYMGIGIDKEHPERPTIWEGAAAKKTLSQDAYTQAMFVAMALMVMDDGHAGTKWKTVYDAAAHADSVLPAGESDRYKNRHALRDMVIAHFGNSVKFRESVEIDATAFSSSEKQALLTSVHKLLSPDDPTVLVSFMPADKMPSYDPDIHYAGLDPQNPHAAIVWVSEKAKQNVSSNMLAGPFALAAMETGSAGTAWKQVYDRVARADAQLPAGASDSYVNRHALEAAVETFLTSSSP